MSTFGGEIPEFPDIRVDYFRPIQGRRPPLKCFLSHIHSDHLAGLDTYKGSFVFCSQATREILLRLERYHHRLNFALGKLESRQLHYSHLKRLLKPIPLETPTRIELEPGNDIQVTLFDANHCIGAVMFLFEGSGKAVLYTGDIRSEPWFVNNLTRSPFLIEYTSGLRQLDCIYLDTSHTQPVEFPTKAEGLKELLEKVSQYPRDTVFHFSAWTFGYEEVWMALSRKLKSPIHVDNYKWKLYRSLRGDCIEKSDKSDGSASFHVSEGPVLAGFQCGNTPQVGCLTRDTNVRIHSCEKGLRCEAVNDNTVWIRPIVTRTNLGVEVAELGVGGGGGDLTQRPELEFDNDAAISQLLEAFAKTESDVLSDIKQLLLKGLQSNQKCISLGDMGIDRDPDNLGLSDLLDALTRAVSEKRSKMTTEDLGGTENGKSLPKVITFPYARHSSYSELCHLVRVFNPNDIYPCTVNEENWHEGVSMKHLFGQHCSPTRFRHDEEMRELQSKRLPQALSQQSHTTNSTQLSPARPKKADFPGPAENTILIGRASSSVMTGSDATTPPYEILATSPGSESQSLRRKAIMEGIVEGRVKRARLHSECDESSPVPDSQAQNEGSTPSPLETRENIQPNLTHTTTATGRSPSFQGSSSTDKERPEDEENPDEYWDPNDEVFRCGSCRHELWISGQPCTECSVEEGHTYFEVTESDLRPIPRIVHGEVDTNSTLDDEGRIELMGDILDFDSSAYDSQDERDGHDDLYEINSFIDDESSLNFQDGGEDSSSDEETDYKQKFFELQNDYFELVDEYGSYVEEHEEMKRYFLGSDYESSQGPDDDLEFTEDGAVMVDIPPLDPVLTEVVLSQSLQESQSQEAGPPDSFEDELVSATEGHSPKSDALNDEENARAEAYDLAVDGRWHEVSLVSTGGNHGDEEAEL